MLHAGASTPRQLIFSLDDLLVSPDSRDCVLISNCRNVPTTNSSRSISSMDNEKKEQIMYKQVKTNSRSQNVIVIRRQIRFMKLRVMLDLSRAIYFARVQIRYIEPREIRRSTDAHYIALDDEGSYNRSTCIHRVTKHNNYLTLNDTDRGSRCI